MALGGASSAWAAEAADAEGAIGLSEVVVTAERRETNLQKTPISVSVVSAKAIEDRHIYSLTDLNDGAAPGLTVTPFASRPFNVILNIRGVGIMSDTNQPAGESGIGVYLDGVYLGRPQGLDAGLYDLQAIEVLKGPQGTLFGRNTEGGALNITTKKPTGKFGMEMLAGLGNYGSYESQFHLNLPEYRDISFKLDAMIQSHDGWVKNPMAGQRDWNEASRRGLRAQLRWAPTDTFTADYAYDTSHTEDTTIFGYTVKAANNVTISPLSVVPNSRIDVAPIGSYLQPSLGDTYGHSLNMRWDVLPWLQLKSISAYRNLYQDQYSLPGTTGIPITANLGAGQNFERLSIAQFKQDQYSQELQAIGQVERLKFIVGGLYFRETTADQAQAFNTLHWDTNGIASGITPIVYTPFGNSVLGPNACLTTPAACASNYNNFYGQPGQTTLVQGLYPNIGVDRASENTTESFGVYGQATWTPPILEDRVRLTAGLRWSKDTKDGQLLVVNNARPFLPDANGQLTNVQGVVKRNQSWQRVNPMVNIAFDVTPDISAYAKWSTGYRAGGFNSRSITYSSYDPEEISMFEAGVKSEFFDHRARLNIAAYTGDYDNIYYNITANYNTFTTDPKTGQLVVVSGSTRTIEDTYNMSGKGKVSGVEVDFDLAPIEGLIISGSYTYASTDMPLFADPVPRPQINSAGVVTGYALNTPTVYHQLYTPENRVTGAIDYRREVFNDATLSLHFDGAWNDGQYSSTGDVSTGTKDASGKTIYLPQLKTEAGAIYNARISISDIGLADSGARLAVAIWARNLFDSNLLIGRSGSYIQPSSSVTGSFNDPRTYGATVSVKY
ncbi:TonB-dependent receptor [Phenylobacterium sp. 20VBR1]|uniref:TonB-dependent receptor n=2 Tax=Phenylobacterium glaciei TaxID=2803784 RepID=A0A941HVM7_9CAUL|nr:TonB-dependent receptor [Phenylobacterium glaciei]MBR7618735.1 TonB-dependent receptor [Phenylobacterium glaciei]